MPVIALLAPQKTAARVFAEYHLERLGKLGVLIDARFSESVEEVIGRLAETEIIISTWGMPKADAEFLDKVPQLRAIFYAAGSIKQFVTPFLWKKGVVLSSAAPANAIPVAEYVFAVMLLSNKQFWTALRGNSGGLACGNYRRKVGIIGASMVGRALIRLLKNTDLDILLYDPFIGKEEAGKLSVKNMELPVLMSESDIVSLHAPNLPHLRHMINAELLSIMKDGAVFVNTARGALVDEEALISQLRAGRISAVLDVTDPEPPAVGSPLRTLPNVIYTPHIAGSMGEECYRMADFAIDEMERYLANKLLVNAIKQESLSYLA